MKKFFTLIIACILLGNIQAQQVHEARLTGIKPHKPYRTNLYDGPAVVVKPQRPRYTNDCEPVYTIGMSREAFEAAKRQLKNETFDSNRLAFAKQISSLNYMTSAQIREIAELFTFDSNRLEFAKHAYKNCVNPGEYFMLFDVFTFSSSARQLSEFTELN